MCDKNGILYDSIIPITFIVCDAEFVNFLFK